MPVIPLKQITYADDQQRMVDVLNDNFRQINWLLNQGHLDRTNFAGDALNEIEPEDPEKDAPVDSYGVNPEYIKFYPNKCYNSSFELFDATTLKPNYWDTNGVVSLNANFDNTYSLKLTPGQYAQQQEVDGEGLADPDWWPWTPDTRIAFRAKGNGGKVTVSVLQGGVAIALWSWGRNAKGNYIKVFSTPPGNTFELDTAIDWPMALRTIAATPTPAGGKITLRMVNTGATDIYIDSVTLEADWTGRWPSIYSHGPRSAGSTVEVKEWLEYGTANWDPSFVEFILVNAYDDEPVPMVSLIGAPAGFPDPVTFICEHIKETVKGSLRYSRIKVTPKCTVLPPITTPGTIALQAICSGKVDR